MENKCHDCKKEIVIDSNEIKNGLLLKYGEDIEIFKCQDCYKKSTALTNYQKCEVYTRIVGYHRPVGQFNIGKKQEYQEREEYKIE